MAKDTQINKKIGREFIKRIEKDVRWCKEELLKDGLRDIEAKAIIADVFRMLGKNAEKLKEKAGLN